MESHADLESTPAKGGETAAGTNNGPNADQQPMQQGSANRTSPAGASAGSAAPHAGDAAPSPSSLHFPGEDGGLSLADLAQRDLDAALQLLADRAEYITGATGAAIALRRNKTNDMLCRASAGPTAPELGALLSAEFGLSGESVRTRQPLLCLDTQRDPRVNREVCRQMGIASVVVMPVVQEDEVLGVFELFSDQANAFGERDLAALRRLGEMVETAVKLAHAVEGLPDRLKAAESAVQPAPRMKPFFWSAANVGDVAEIPQHPDQSHVPPVMRNLHKCGACGFPVSAGRALCVECEEKKWRGQLTIRPPANQGADGASVAGRFSAANRSPAAQAVTTSHDLAPSSASSSPNPAESARVQVPTSGEGPVASKPVPAPEARPSALESATGIPDASAPLLVLSAGLEPSQSWLAANKYILGAVLVVAAVVAAIVFLR